MTFDSIFTVLTSEFGRPTHTGNDKATWNFPAGTVAIEGGCFAVGCEYKALVMYVEGTGTNAARIVPLPLDEVVRRAKSFLGGT